MNVIRSPYAVKPRKLIEKLIAAGYLRRDRKHSAEAVEKAIEELRRYSKNRLEGTRS